LPLEEPIVDVSGSVPRLFRILLNPNRKADNEIIALSIANMFLACRFTQDIRESVQNVLSSSLQLAQSVFSGSSSGSFCFVFACLLGASLLSLPEEHSEATFPSVVALFGSSNPENWGLLFQLLSRFKLISDSIMTVILDRGFWKSSENTKYASLYICHAMSSDHGLRYAPKAIELADALLSNPKRVWPSAYILCTLANRIDLQSIGPLFVKLLSKYQTTRSDEDAKSLILFASCLWVHCEAAFQQYLIDIQHNLPFMLLSSLFVKYMLGWPDKDELKCIAAACCDMFMALMLSEAPENLEACYSVFKCLVYTSNRLYSQKPQVYLVQMDQVYKKSISIPFIQQCPYLPPHVSSSSSLSVSASIVKKLQRLPMSSNMLERLRSEDHTVVYELEKIK
jgi:hypothetical protein